MMLIEFLGKCAEKSKSKHVIDAIALKLNIPKPFDIEVEEAWSMLHQVKNVVQGKPDIQWIKRIVERNALVPAVRNSSLKLCLRALSSEFFITIFNAIVADLLVEYISDKRMVVNGEVRSVSRAGLYDMLKDVKDDDRTTLEQVADEVSERFKIPRIIEHEVEQFSKVIELILRIESEKDELTEETKAEIRNMCRRCSPDIVKDNGNIRIGAKPFCDLWFMSNVRALLIEEIVEKVNEYGAWR